MRWPFGRRSKRTGGRAPAGAGSLETTRRERDRPRSEWTPSEETVLNDGQLGAANLQRGPEQRNPEGSIDLSNPDYWRGE